MKWVTADLSENKIYKIPDTKSTMIEGCGEVVSAAFIYASVFSRGQLFFLWCQQEVEPLPFAPILGTLHFAPSETESGQLVKGPASLKIDKLEGLTERIRIGTTGRSYQMHKKWVSKQVHTAAKLMAQKQLQAQTGHRC